MADGRMARRPPPHDRRDGAAARTPEEYRQPYIPPQSGRGIPEPYATPEPPPGPTRGAPYRRRRPDDTGEWRRDSGSGARGAAAVPPRQYLNPDARGGVPAGRPEYGYGAPASPGGYGSYDGEYGEYGEYGPPAYGYAPPANGYGPAAPANGYGPAAPTNGYGPGEPTNGYGPPGSGREYGTRRPDGFGAAGGYGPPTNGQYGPPTNGQYGPPTAGEYGASTNGYGVPTPPNGYAHNGYAPPAGANGYGPSEERSGRHTGEIRRPPAGAAPRGQQTGEIRRPPVDTPGRHTGEFRRPPADPSGAQTDGYGFRRPREYGYGQPPGYGPPPNGYDGYDRYDARDARDARPDRRRDDGRPPGDQHAEWISRGGSEDRVTPHETGRWSASRGSWVPTGPPENAPDFAIGRFEETGDMRRGPLGRGPRVVDGVGWSERIDQRPEWHPHTWDEAPTGRSTDWSEGPLPPPRPRTAEPWMRAASASSERDADTDRLVGDAVPAGTLGAVLAPLVWFALAVGAYLVAVMLLNDGAERSAAIRVAIDSLPWLGVASTMSVGVSLTLRWLGAGWRAAGLGFAAAVVSGTVITVLHSLLVG